MTQSAAGLSYTLPAGASIVSDVSTNVTTVTTQSSSTSTLLVTSATNAYGATFARSRVLAVQLNGMKPFTKLYAFTNSQNTTNNVIPCARITISGESKTPFYDATTIVPSTETTQLRSVTYEYNTLYTQAYIGSLYQDEGIALTNYQINIGEIVRYYVTSTSFYAGIVIARQVEINAQTNAANTVLHVACMKLYTSKTAYTDDVSTKTAGSFPIGVTIKGDLSKATATITSISIPSTGTITTNSLGNFYGLYVVGAGALPIGKNNIIFTDDSTGGQLSTTTATATYTAAGELDVTTNNFVTQTNVLATTVVSGTENITYTDPIAETFIIPAAQANGAFITSVDLFFQQVVTTETQPVIVQITNTVNGYPGNSIIPNAVAMLQPANIKTSNDATVSTRFYFQGPVFLFPGTEYALKVLSNSVNYKLYISTMGQPTVASATNIVSQQPYLGSFFQSQNNSTWTANQLQDLTFVINAAQFNTSTAGSVILQNQGNNGQFSMLPPNPFTTVAGQSLVKVYWPNHGLFNGAYTSFQNFDANAISSMVLASSGTAGTYNAINSSGAWVTTVTNVINNNIFYVTLPTVAAYSSGTVGGILIQSPTSYRYDALELRCGSYLNPTGASTSISLKPASSSSIAQAFGNASGTNQPLYVHSDLNEANLFGGAKSLQLQINISTINSDLSPIFSVSSLTAGLYSNKVNNPMPTDSTIIDNTTLVTSGNSITFSPSFYGYISGTVLTVTSSMTLATGAVIFGAGVASGTTITTGATSTTFVVGPTQTIGSALSPVVLSTSVASNSLLNVINVPTTVDINQFKIGAMITVTGSTYNNWSVELLGIDTTTTPFNITTSQPKFNGYVSGTTLTTSSSITLLAGQPLFGSGIPSGTVIVTGGTNATTFVLNNSFTAGSIGGLVSFNVQLVQETNSTTNIVQASGWIDEIAPLGGTALAKYQTIPLTLVNPSSAIQISFAAMIPPAADIQLYYRATMTSGNPITKQNWTLVPLTYNKNASAYVDQLYTLNGLTDFNVIQFKIVMITTNTSQVANIQNFSAICLA